jgi:hypothetical protein
LVTLSNKWDLESRYQNNAAHVNVRGYFENSSTHQRTSFNITCKVDTGFYSGIYSFESLRSDAQIIGVNPVLTTIRLADGSEVPVYLCLAYIEKINEVTLPLPGKIVQLFMRGTGFSYLGMEALHDWITLFDGPTQTLKIKI